MMLKWVREYLTKVRLPAITFLIYTTQYVESVKHKR